MRCGVEESDTEGPVRFLGFFDATGWPVTVSATVCAMPSPAPAMTVSGLCVALDTVVRP